jgi:hypothetical protein
VSTACIDARRSAEIALRQGPSFPRTFHTSVHVPPGFENYTLCLFLSKVGRGIHLSHSTRFCSHTHARITQPRRKQVRRSRLVCTNCQRVQVSVFEWLLVCGRHCSWCSCSAAVAQPCSGCCTGHTGATSLRPYFTPPVKFPHSHKIMHLHSQECGHLRPSRTPSCTPDPLLGEPTK